MARTSDEDERQLAAAAHQLRAALRSQLERARAGARLRTIWASYRRVVDAPVEADEFADLYAQALVCGAFAWRLLGPQLQRPGASAWLMRSPCPVCRTLLRACARLAEGRRAGDWLGADTGQLLQTLARQAAEGGDAEEPDAACGFYERFLQRYDEGRRARQGVFYTPPALVRFTVQGADQLLREEFHLPDGICDASTWGELSGRRPPWPAPHRVRAEDPFVQVLDPAVGAGAFLLEIIDLAARRMRPRWTMHQAAAQAELWSRYVADQLLPRLFGLEVMLPAAVIAQLRIAAKLAETGYDFRDSKGLGIFLANTLADPAPFLAAGRGRRACADDVRGWRPCTVIIGNPPFAGVSNNRQRWVTQLLRGRSPTGGETASYYEAEGAPLKERKTWLQDDYVKFLRYAQWRLEAVHCGLIALVTNHGYLDNVTFRGVRQQLMRFFPGIAVVDLHGNRKKLERAPDGGIDQSVFETEQGVAVAFFRRPPAAAASAREVWHGELWGDRQSKCQRLDAAASHRLVLAIDERLAKSCGNSRETKGRDSGSSPSLTLTPLRPLPPYFWFAPTDQALQAEYQRGWPLTRVFPVNTTVPVTARDGFVIAFDREELLRRLELFRDLAISDEEIRRRFFCKRRSFNHELGDTRGWKLSLARRQLAAEGDWRRHVRRCLYRPFDWRAIYWTRWMIDWPREQVVRHLLAGDNLALIARRQMPPSQPCNYFWVTDDIPLDGLIRSDNRGSESMFPLYLCADEPADESARRARQCPRAIRRANVSPHFVRAAEQTWKLRWRGEGQGDLRRWFGPEDLAHFCYALFHSHGYRRRFAPWLRTDFPRVLLPTDVGLLRELCRLGAELTSLHLLRTAPPPAPPTAAGPEPGTEVAAGYPRYAHGKIYLQRDVCMAAAPEELWRFQVGGRQVLRQWLRDRRGRPLDADQLACYRRIIAALARTVELMDEADQAISQAGGWRKAFAGARPEG